MSAQKKKKLYDFFPAFTLTTLFHILAIIVAFLPLGNYFFPFVDDLEDSLSQQEQGYLQSSTGKDSAYSKDWYRRDEDDSVPDTYKNDPGDTIPYQFAQTLFGAATTAADTTDQQLSTLNLFSNNVGVPRIISRSGRIPKLLPPSYSKTTIPVKPVKSMLQVIEENAEDYLLSSVFEEAVPAEISEDDLLKEERLFKEKVREDLIDGRLNMGFAEFVIPAEFFLLSRALLDKGLQPSFSLEEAFDQYKTKLNRVRAGLSDELNGFDLVMILQRYAENKFYPGDGSGMLLDGLFHNLNDCEGGTKEVISYMDSLYPQLTFGSNRGMLRTTSGEVIGHMQVYIYPHASTQPVLENSQGLVIETTAISEESIKPYRAGEVYPIEDFVGQFYPELLVGTPLEYLLYDRNTGEKVDVEARNIVGTSNHPLKMSYGTGFSLLSEQLYDLENIRTRQLTNKFQQSPIPECNPYIDPLKVSRQNIFSNFVAIDAKLRGSLIRHYLADMELWDNQVMPQWKIPEFLPNYLDLEATLMEETEPGEHAQIQVDSENLVAREALESHARFLLKQKRQLPPAHTPYLNFGERRCENRALVDDPLLAYLFKVPLAPGLFFLPEPGENFPWKTFSQDILGDCLAVPYNKGDRKLFDQLTRILSEKKESFRMQLFNSVQNRGVQTISDSTGAGSSGVGDLATLQTVSEVIFTGRDVGGSVRVLSEYFQARHSEASTEEEPSVTETVKEFGRTGVNTGLLWDTLDFLGPESLMLFAISYVSRPDLKLSVTRSGILAQNIVTLLFQRGVEKEEMRNFLLTLYSNCQNENLQLGIAIAQWQFLGKNPSDISSGILSWLAKRTQYSNSLVLELLPFGLAPEDAISHLQQRIEGLGNNLPQLFTTASTGGGRVAPEIIFSQLTELVKSIRYFKDPLSMMLLDQKLGTSLIADLQEMSKSQERVKETSEVKEDLGIIITKLYLLALLQKVEGEMWPGEVVSYDDGELFTSFLKFSETVPLAKVCVSLVLQAYSDKERKQLINMAVVEQLDLLRSYGSLSIKEKKGDKERDLDKLVKSVGRSNIIYRMLLLDEKNSQAEWSALLANSVKGQVGKKPAQLYLENFHNNLAPAVNNTLREKNQLMPLTSGNSLTKTALRFYTDTRVRESMSLLGNSDQPRAGRSEEQAVKFRKSKDLRDLKDLSKIKVIKGPRMVTRQGMSLLTLGLNSNNSPEMMANFWSDNLEVLENHIRLQPDSDNRRQYLFAPHHPYLTLNDRGFYFPPETVRDLHNASMWGGKNDILLTSYLHFKNLPEHLPNWLLETALTRSEFELRIIRKFEQQTFLPMILECSSDKEEFPDALFEAKWATRKPFGEDIFPGTLLLLRMGYMEVTSEGEITLTAKGRQVTGKV